MQDTEMIRKDEFYVLNSSAVARSTHNRLLGRVCTFGASAAWGVRSSRAPLARLRDSVMQSSAKNPRGFPIQDIVQYITGLTAIRQTVLIGIDGGAGTGKTTLFSTDS